MASRWLSNWLMALMVSSAGAPSIWPWPEMCVIVPATLLVRGRKRLGESPLKAEKEGNSMFIAVALAAFTLTAAAPPGDAPVPPPEEQVLARREFDAALTANGIDPAAAYAVACTSLYSTVPNDPTTPVVSSFCWGLIGTPTLDPSQPPPELYASNNQRSSPVR
jgi:hypothetical protein